MTLHDNRIIKNGAKMLSDVLKFSAVVLIAAGIVVWVFR